MNKRIQILLVEDEDADADIVEGLLKQQTRLEYQLSRAGQMSEAESFLRDRQEDVLVILDLELPDSQGLSSLKRIQDCSLGKNLPVTPVIVMTGTQDEDKGLEAIRRGAQDFLIKGEVSSLLLERAIHYAIERNRLVLQLEDEKEKEIQALKKALSQDESMTGWQDSKVTAKMSGIGPLRERAPERFSAMEKKYESLLDKYLDSIGFGEKAPREQIGALANDIGNLGGGPRDVVDLHIGAVKAKSKNEPSKRVIILSTEGRLLTIELMGYLVDYYRMDSRMASINKGGKE